MIPRKEPDNNFFKASEELEDCYKNVDAQLNGKFPGISEVFEGTTVASLAALGSGLVGSYLNDRVIEPAIQQELYRRNKSNILDVDLTQTPSRGAVVRAAAISTLLADAILVFINANVVNHEMGAFYDEKLKARANCRSQVNSKYGTSFGETTEDKVLEKRRDVILNPTFQRG
jgi:hypothetical protein